MQMTKLVNHDVIHDVNRRMNQPPIQLNAAIGFTAAPPCSVVFDLDVAWVDPHLLLINIDAKMQFLHSACEQPLFD